MKIQTDEVKIKKGKTIHQNEQKKEKKNNEMIEKKVEHCFRLYYKCVWNAVENLQWLEKNGK